MAILAPSAAASGSEDGSSTVFVERPEAGLARGRWEAPAWMFYLVAAVAVVGSVIWAALALRGRRSAR
jgi:hypothetical protein